MANELIKKEFNHIFSNKDYSYPLNATMATSWIIAHYKGFNIKAFNMQGSSSLCDYNVIATVTNSTQAKSLVNELCSNLKQHDINIISTEGLTDAEWILIDAGDIIIHIFEENTRELYNLDKLWIEHEQVKIPTEFYFAAHEKDEVKETGPTDYF